MSEHEHRAQYHVFTAAPQGSRCMHKKCAGNVNRRRCMLEPAQSCAALAAAYECCPSSCRHGRDRLQLMECHVRAGGMLFR